MPRYWFPKPYADQVARLRVPSGFLLVAAFAYFSKPSGTSLSVGLPLSVLGLSLRAWASGYLEKNRVLAQGGPYRFTRNPLYIGTLLTASGLAIAGRSIALALVFAAVFVFVYLPVIELEEQHLRSLFPAYAEYAERVPKLIGWPASSGAHNTRFHFATYRRNREYQAILGFLAGAAFLIWKWRGI